MLTTCLDGWVDGLVALEEWKLRLTSARVEVEVEAQLGHNVFVIVANESNFLPKDMLCILLIPTSSFLKKEKESQKLYVG